MTWGNIAIGCRIQKHPEAAFFASWTGLLVQGMRQNDIVLAPSTHMPAHWASDFLVRQFLKSDCDSLLMIDDDMAFEYDALEKMRTNQDNYDYDIVFGFCVTREMPPKPVIMHNTGQGYIRPEKIKIGDVIPVDLVGLAFTLIKRPVFVAMMETNDIDNEFFFSYGHGRQSDEATFCKRAIDNGFKMAVDTNVTIDHIAAIPLNWRYIR